MELIALLAMVILSIGLGLVTGRITLSIVLSFMARGFVRKGVIAHARQ